MTRARTNADQAHTESLSVEPHIIPGVLYPAVAGKLLDGSTSHSGNYGTAQADGYSYYYTDIKGSKPIKDPRIGGHFGSQRYKFTSLQLLEQETATEGKNIYSIDGREWLRAYTGNSEWINYYDQNGTYLQAPTDCTGNFIELTGYFNDINFAITTHSNRCDDIDISVNGTLSVDGSATLGGRTTVASPLGSRFVSMGSLINGGSTLSASLGTTPQINTVRYEMKTGSGEYVELHAIELIAQDTTSTANKSKIQIPSQNVVSYGKKFTVSGTPHYDPFNGFTNDTTLFSSVVDVATSLGLGTATTWGAPWDKGSNNHIRPFNGGRVVKWVDSSGTIKTSVTMMPANAQNVGTTASNEITTASATNSHTINFSDDAVESSLSEVAKTFHWREFGNGAANGGTGATYADASMLNTDDDIAYVMDDGLTSLSGKGWKSHATYGLQSNGVNESVYLTFIGTGISWKARSVTHGGNDEFRWFVDGVEVKVYDGSGTTSEYEIIAQNLPYGTHIVEIRCVAQANNADQSFHEFTFHQPKKPPIPEDAVVLADYMLMADFVPTTSDGTAGLASMSKGIRFCVASRDTFFDSGASISGEFTNSDKRAFTTFYNTNANSEARIVGFGHAFISEFDQWGNRQTDIQVRLDGSNYTYNSSNQFEGATGGIWDNTNDDGTISKGANNLAGVSMYGIKNQTLGIHTFGDKKTSGTDYNTWNAWGIATPTHTSSHYQTFETPFLHELVGGDRNMEQHNLVVTPDGKTWDEVTRDTSYMGNVVLNTNTDTAYDWSSYIIWDEWRGKNSSGDERSANYFNKDWAIAWNTIICLKDGWYKLTKIVGDSEHSGQHAIYHVENDASVANGQISAADQTSHISAVVFCKRGDQFRCYGHVSGNWKNEFFIERV